MLRILRVGPRSLHLAGRLVTLALPFATFALPLATRLAAQGAPLRDEMAAALRTHALPGASWVLVTPDTIETGAAGVRDRRTGAPMRADDRVHVGSVTKTITALAVLRLATLGRVDLDAPIRRYVADLPLENPWERTAPVRVRHLLDHTSGLADAHFWQVFTARGDPDAPLADQLVRPGQRLHVRRTPGSAFLYSNVGYAILGLLVERVTGERYERWVDRELLAPLGMTRSTMAFTTQVGTAADSSLVMGHFDGVTPQPAYAIPVRPASQFTTTPADMGRLLRFLMHDGTVDGRPFVDRALLEAMGTATTTDAARAGLSGGYALGLVTRERWGTRMQCHLGNIGTFRALLCLHRPAQRALFVAYNTDPEALPWDRVDSLLAARLQLPQEPPTPTATLAVDARAWRGWYLARPRFEQFAWLDLVGSPVRADWDGTRLRLAPLGGTARDLVPAGGRFLRATERRAATHVLLGDPADGETRRISDGQRTLEPVSFVRLVLAWASAVAGVLALVVLLVGGVVRLARARTRATLAAAPVRWTIAVLLLACVLPLLHATQPFLAIGDPTVANVATALVTALLALAIGAGIVGTIVRWSRLSPAWRRTDLVTLCAAGQWIVVLAWHGLVPLMLWR